MSKRYLCYLVVLIASSKSGWTIAADTLQTQLDRQQMNQSSQRHIDQLSDKQKKLVAEFRELTQQTRMGRVFNEHLKAQTQNQQQEVHALERQIAQIAATEKALIPWMLEAIAELEQWVINDTPFLLEERMSRVEQLKSLMVRADIALADKYRRMIEAWRAELEYANSTEVYSGKLRSSNTDEQRSAKFLRLGRLAWYYLTPDHQQAGVWNQANKQWQLVANEHIPALIEAMDVVNKTVVPGFLALPMPDDKLLTLGGG